MKAGNASNPKGGKEEDERSSLLLIDAEPPNDDDDVVDDVVDDDDDGVDAVGATATTASGRIRDDEDAIESTTVTSGEFRRKIRDLEGRKRKLEEENRKMKEEHEDRERKTKEEHEERIRVLTERNRDVAVAVVVPTVQQHSNEPPAAANANANAVVTTSGEFRLKIREAENRERQTIRELEESRNQTRNLATQLRNATQNVESKTSRAILAFLAGFFGYAPPLWFSMDEARAWIRRRCCCCRRLCCCRWCIGTAGSSEERNENHDTDRDNDDNDDDVSAGGGNRILAVLRMLMTFLRLVMIFVVFLVDLADAVVDFWVSLRDMIGLSSDEDSASEDPYVWASNGLSSEDFEDSPRLFGWALWLFIATAVGRTIGGLFAVVYKDIHDKADREASYLLVELTILYVEDFAAFYVLCVKLMVYGVKSTDLDNANFFLTITCVFVFGIPTVCHWKHVAKSLPRCVSRLVFAWSSFWFLFLVYLLFPGGAVESWAVRSPMEYEWYVRGAYSSFVLVQAIVMYFWYRYLQGKIQPQPVSTSPSPSPPRELLQRINPDPGDRILRSDDNDNNNIATPMEP